MHWATAAGDFSYRLEASQMHAMLMKILGLIWMPGRKVVISSVYHSHESEIRRKSSGYE